ncbi:MAG: molecular chaperone HtpG [Porticoccaceae bacterium]
MTTKTETHVFQAEAKQLLHLMTHSLYSNREIFVRELVSNASDACDKLRFEALDKDDLYEGETDLKIRIDVDSKKKTISVTDNGIGMSKDEVIANIRTIASSGTAKFLENLTGDQKKDSALIGQFGVGFYSSFIVADKVEVFTRRAGLKPEEGVYWSASGEAEYEIGNETIEQRGTRVVLHLKKDAREFADDWKVRSIVKKYSDHIAIPVEMEKPYYGDDKDKPKTPEYEPVNSVKALWTKSRSELKDEDYKEFYKHISHDFEEPLTWSHNRVEGKLDYTSLLYLPRKPLFDLYNRESPKGLKLYVRRTFILDDAEQFLPLYLRFVKGVVDSNDLPLNVSREILQHSPQVDSIKSALTKRVLDMLAKMAKKDPDKYQQFWDSFGSVLKEGPVEDPANQEKVAELLRFATTKNDSDTQDQSLNQYIERMPEGQDKIYYIIGDSSTVVRKSPLLEAFKSKGYEVLLLTDRIDEWLMSNLTEYKETPFQDVARGELPDLDKDEKADKSEDEKKEDSALIERVKEYLGGRVSEVRESHRLVDSPACLVIGDQDMGLQMRRIMEAAGQAVPEAKPILELNLKHPLVKRVEDTAEEEVFGDLTEILFDQARLSVGEQLDDPVSYVSRINKLLFSI